MIELTLRSGDEINDQLELASQLNERLAMTGMKWREAHRITI